MSFISLITGSFRNTGVANGTYLEEFPYEKSFSQHYINHIKPKVMEFEQKRMKALKKASTRMRLAIPIVPALLSVIAYISYALKAENPEFIIIFSTFITFAAAQKLIYSPINNYTQSIKSDIFPQIISFLGNYNYSQTCPPIVRDFQESNIIPYHDREINEDRISGEYKSVQIDLFETCLEQIRHTGKGGSYYVEIFHGLIISLSLHKPFKGKTVIKTDSGKFGNWLADKFPKLDRVRLEDPLFEKKFEVFSSDQIEARYLLTTAFMERLLRLNEIFGNHNLECSFYNNKLLIKIAQKENMFEPGSMYEAEDFIDDSKKLLKEINLIFEIINILKLNQNIGL